jgi:hypothetical protein
MCCSRSILHPNLWWHPLWISVYCVAFRVLIPWCKQLFTQIEFKNLCEHHQQAKWPETAQSKCRESRNKSANLRQRHHRVHPRWVVPMWQVSWAATESSICPANPAPKPQGWMQNSTVSAYPDQCLPRLSFFCKKKERNWCKEKSNSEPKLFSLLAKYKVPN